MPEIATGLLMCRKNKSQLEYFLVHPGGPFYAKKTKGVWSIPKGMPNDGEELLEAAQREFFEETGLTAAPPFFSLDTVKLKSGKIVHAWMFQGDWDVTSGITSNTFELEWPPSSKKKIMVPEVDRAAWMNLDNACEMIHPLQIPFLHRAEKIYRKFI